MIYTEYFLTYIATNLVLQKLSQVKDFQKGKGLKDNNSRHRSKSLKKVKTELYHKDLLSDFLLLEKLVIRALRASKLKINYTCLRLIT